MTPDELQATDEQCRKAITKEPLLRDMRSWPSPAALRAVAVALFEHELAVCDCTLDASLVHAAYTAAMRENVLANAAWVLGRLRYEGFVVCNLAKIKQAVGE
ncbi:MAG TPA: hypothetical protein VGF56_05860 [Rhizomicrobium sp.]|jgi:hypothetical protein